MTHPKFLIKAHPNPVIFQTLSFFAPKKAHSRLMSYFGGKIQVKLARYARNVAK